MLLICLVLLSALILVSLAVGTRSLTLKEILTGLAGQRKTVASIIIWRMRMPRTVLAVVVGAALAVAGVVMQGLTRNPLAEPGILGVNAGASLAVVLSLSVLGVDDVGGYLWFAFAGAALAAGLVHLMARRSADAGPARLVLAGGGAGSQPARHHRHHHHVRLQDLRLLPLLGPGLARPARRRPAGVDRPLPRRRPRACPGLRADPQCPGAGGGTGQGPGGEPRTGARPGAGRHHDPVRGVTAAVGPISFVGLVVPQVLRLALGADQRKLLAVSLVAGPILLLGADILGCVLIVPAEMEAGVVTAFIGGPVLLAMVVRRTGVRTR